jgi:N-formylglutamate amidohydrolase
MSYFVRHIPHSSTVIPERDRGAFVLSDAEIEHELLLMTDRYTDELFADVPGPAVISPVSRLVVDVERFEDDELEPMAACGMGVVYTRTHDGQTLRRAPSEAEREELLDLYYRPHHAAFESAVERALVEQGRVLIIDCHSYPLQTLPFEIFDHETRPEIGIGTDAFHTDDLLASRAVWAFARRGFSVALNKPFPGAITPLKFYGRESRVQSLMVEVRRDLYMDERTGSKLPVFDSVKARIGVALVELGERTWSTS